MKRIIFLPVGFVVLLVVAFLWWNTHREENAFKEAKIEVSMRKIGHEVLLLSGDSTSRVLPVEQLGRNGYRLRFEARFAFVPGALIKTIHRVAKAENLPSGYILKVRECTHNQVVYAYQETPSPTNSAPQCGTREQPKNCYSIEILLKPSERFSSLFLILASGGAILLLIIGIFILRRQKRSANTNSVKESVPDAVIVLANYRFHYRDRYLMLGEEQIRLTAKQTKLLHLFALSPNQIIERAVLTKVWEDEGVIVGRSLDVFVSKLRKIFEADPSVRLVNVHSRGYILEVDE